MNTVLWICQVFLAALFLFSGSMKSTQSERWLVAHNQTGVEGLPMPLIKFIGIAEILGAAGVILPWWLGVAPVLTPIAALGFAVIMMLAAPIHYRRKEPQNVLINVLVLLVSLFVAWGRLQGLYPM